MANTKVTSRVIADNSVGITQLNVSDGSDGQVLTTNGSGTLSFTTISAGVAGISSSADATAITIDSSERVGIGTASPASKLQVSVAGDPEVRLTNTSASETMRFDHNSMRTLQASSLSIMTNDSSSQQFRIASDGRMSMGSNTNSAYSSYERVGIREGSGSQNFGLGIQMTGTPLGLWNKNDSGYHATFAYGSGGGLSGSISYSTTSVTYGSASDYRLKENVDYTWDATTRLKQLKPCRFNWIADSTNTLQDGFLAHEVANVVPEAVVGEKDAIYTAEEALQNPNTEEGDAKTQMLDNAKLVPLLVKALQELEARIETLEG